MKSGALRQVLIAGLILAGLAAILAIQDTYFPSKEALRSKADAAYVRKVRAQIEADRLVMKHFKESR